MNAQTITKFSSSTSALKYELLTTHVDDLEQMSYTTYGMRVLDENGNILFSHPDISTSMEQVQIFIDKLRGHDVSALHIRDLLEDYLG